jgi:hypothetical protein
MNHAIRTEQLHTFDDVPRLTINKWYITGHSDWDSTARVTVQIATEADGVPAAIETFLAGLHGASYRSEEDIELLRRFAGAMGLMYECAPGVSK